MSYVIGDIHGCLLTLKSLYNQIKNKEEIYSVGDIIDKGPDSALCLDFIINNNIKAVKGNHERFFEIYIPRYLNGENIFDSKWYLLWGGKKTIDSYKVYGSGNIKQKMKEHLEFISKLPYFYYLNEKDENGRECLITHGFGLPYVEQLSELSLKTQQAITCNRLFGSYFDINKEKDSLFKYNVFNVFGHDAFLEVYKDDLFFGIDTGCAYGKTKTQGGKLTAFHWPSKNTISLSVLDSVDYIFEGE